jgi:hypothetical protein
LATEGWLFGVDVEWEGKGERETRDGSSIWGSFGM